MSGGDRRRVLSTRRAPAGANSCHLVVSWGREDLARAGGRCGTERPSASEAPGASWTWGCVLLEEGVSAVVHEGRTGAWGLGWRRPGLEAVGHCRRLAGAARALRGLQPLGSAGPLLCVWLLFTWWKEAGYLHGKCHKKYMFFSNAKRLLSISRVVFDFSFVSYENGGFM